MHPSVMDWAANRIGEHDLNHPDRRVLEVGSFNVNGTVRTMFTHVRTYHGVDIRPGPGPIAAGPITRIARSAGTVSAATSTETATLAPTVGAPSPRAHTMCLGGRRSAPSLRGNPP